MWLTDNVIYGLCDSLIMWLADYDSDLCDLLIIWHTDYVSYWLCDLLIIWLTDYVTWWLWLTDLGVLLIMWLIWLTDLMTSADQSNRRRQLHRDNVRRVFNGRKSSSDNSVYLGRTQNSARGRRQGLYLP